MAIQSVATAEQGVCRLSYAHLLALGKRLEMLVFNRLTKPRKRALEQLMQELNLQPDRSQALAAYTF